MKHIYALMAIAILIMTGCNQMDKPVDPTTKQNSKNLAITTHNLDIDKIKTAADKVLAEYKANTVLNGKLPAISKSTDLVVPDDYATIQGAVNAAGPGTHIRVKAGTYTESVTITTSGIEVKAVGEVTLNGRFLIYASGVTIKDFNVVINDVWGVYAANTSGVQILNTTVTNGYVGIVFWSCNNSVVI